MCLKLNISRLTTVIYWLNIMGIYQNWVYCHAWSFSWFMISKWSHLSGFVQQSRYRAPKSCEILFLTKALWVEQKGLWYHSIVWCLLQDEHRNLMPWMKKSQSCDILFLLFLLLFIRHWLGEWDVKLPHLSLLIWHASQGFPHMNNIVTVLKNAIFSLKDS